jgi:cytochrome c oxidase cbb3-type subunit I/II
MYYFVPKAANRPVYSYRLSIIHFWSLVFIYIWAGPHHLLYTALPEWAQTLGMVCSVALVAPSWGGMINGLLTLRGVWDKVREEPTLKFMALAVTFYGMSTFEGPMMAIKSVNMISHYTDWTIGHVHSGTIGWNIMLTAGMLYYLVAKLWNTEVYSKKLATYQFWLATIGLVLYIVSMWAAGITQSLMWRAIDPATAQLVYPNFIETVVKIVPMYWVRAFGGTLVLTSYLIMVYNLFKTMAQGSTGKVEVYEAYALDESSVEKNAAPHRNLEGLPFVFAVLAVLAILVGTGIEIFPALFSSKYVAKIDSVKPYTPLELAGRDIYIREGCYLCHSQMIRPMVHEVLRYGKASEAGESIYDHPFQWGSKRTGPDLARVGGKYPNMWHYRHMYDPREVTPGSIMPRYTWLFEQKIDYASLPKKLSVMKTLGVPYSDEEIANGIANAQKQAEEITANLVESKVPAEVLDKEIVALVAYLQRLGKDYGQAAAATAAK